jgi:hypothetical protein
VLAQSIAAGVTVGAQFGAPDDLLHLTMLTGRLYRVRNEFVTLSCSQASSQINAYFDRATR